MSPEDFLRVTNLLPEAALLVRLDGTVTAANSSAGRLLRQRADQICGCNVAAFVTDPTPQVAAYLASCSRTTGAIPGRLTVCRPDGEAIPCQVRGALLQTGPEHASQAIFLRLVPSSESPSQFALLNRHIHELTQEVARRSRAEEKLARQHQALQDAHEELSLTNEELQSANEELVLSNEELQSQQQELRRANEEKDRFLAMLAHELRNPIAPVRTALYVLGVAPPDSPAWKRNRETAERQIAHMSRLIEDLLDVSRITMGRIRLKRSSLDFAELVRQTVEDYRLTIEAEGVGLTLVLPAAAVWIQADADRLSQVIVNLLDNARKFTPIGGEVTVSLHVENERFAVLSVADTGIGIPPEELPFLFEVFTQADQSLDRAAGGLGLGLALVKGLVTLHRGEVAVRSEGPGHGAEFIVRLHVETDTAPLASVVGAAPPQPRRVLIIEDNREAAESLRDLLELYGYRVAVAYTGEEGLPLASDFRPDVVLCDLGLPGISGYEVAEALRQKPSTASVGLIAVTGYGADADRSRTAAAGFDKHLVKPVDPSVLLTSLADHVGKTE